jgi:malonyl-CoA O-methyltransferase
MLVTALEGHRLWSSTYDSTPNALLALDQRILSVWLGPLAGLTVIDVGSGTGRWVQYGREHNACAVGFDACVEMLQQAGRKAPVQGQVAAADATLLPVRSRVADIVICSFCLSYLQDPLPAMLEMGRVTRPGGRVVISDLHPDAERAGWKRSFRCEATQYELMHCAHSDDLLAEYAAHAGLKLIWQTSASFGPSEEFVFRAARKEHLFAQASRIPALRAVAWRKL